MSSPFGHTQKACAVCGGPCPVDWTMADAGDGTYIPYPVTAPLQSLPRSRYFDNEWDLDLCSARCSLKHHEDKYGYRKEA